MWVLLQLPVAEKGPVHTQSACHFNVLLSSQTSLTGEALSLLLLDFYFFQLFLLLVLVLHMPYKSI